MAALVGRMHHSVLGERFCYDALTDPVAIGCLVRAVRGQQEQATYKLHDGDAVVGQREPTLSLQLDEASAEDSPVGCVILPLEDGAEFRVARVIDADLPAGRSRLIATWAGGSGAIAGLS